MAKDDKGGMLWSKKINSFKGKGGRGTCSLYVLKLGYKTVSIVSVQYGSALLN